MEKLWFRVELLSDIVVTADSATEGGHKGLDYLPGSLFMGAAVAAYIKENKKFNPSIFLEGKLRFLDGYPEINQTRSLPMPLSFHREKNGQWDRKIPITVLSDVTTQNSQLKQWRSGFCDIWGATIPAIRLQSRMKTAVDRDLRRSKDGQLFGYESIPAGSVYTMGIQAELKEDADFVKKLFSDNEIKLGRSRSAEYGRVKIKIGQAPNEGQKCHEKEKLVIFYLKSDMCLSRDGMPVLLPEAKDFKLTEGSKLVTGQTFIRTRRYSPWNSFFNSRMSERQVISKGSVIVFECPEKPDLKKIEQSFEAGVGMHREEGLGQVDVNPHWIMEPPVLRKPRVFQGEKHADMPDTKLVKFLKHRSDERKISFEAYNMGLSWAKDFEKAINAMKKNGVKTPGKSQWATIRGIASSCMKAPECLAGKIEAFCCEGMRKKQWTADTNNLYREISGKLSDKAGVKECMTLYYAASAVQRLLNNKERGEK